MEGVTCKAWDYTNRIIIPAADYERKMKEEIERFKALPGDRNGKKGIWTVDFREGRVFEEDELKYIKGIADGKQQKLNESGITKIK